MDERKCACANFERLEGASVPAYIAAFLELLKGGTAEARNQYRCRICGQIWEKRAPHDEHKRAMLIKISNDES
jgi:rubrerythrin